MAGNEGRRIFIRISGKFFIAETGNVHCLKRTGICLFTWLSKNKTECTAKCTCSLQNLLSVQAKLLHWDKLFLCPVGATDLKKQKTVFPLKSLYSEMDECLSIKRKPGPPKEEEFFFFKLLLLGVRKTNSKNRSLYNITYELGACNYTLSFEIKAVVIAVCLVFYRMNHVSSLGIHYKCKALLRLIVVSGSPLKSSGGGLH